jgi:hypothetical protein
MNEPDPPTIRAGTYRHNKSGNLYNVLGVALQTETNEFLVIYRALYDTKFELFARPYDMFTETVNINGQQVPRFEYISGVGVQ